MPRERDALAATSLADLEDERRWSEVFANSQDLLAEMAAEACAEHRPAPGGIARD